MDVILIYAAVAVLLFVMAYLHKRRYGLLGLALASGYVLSEVWGYEINLLVSGLGLPSGPETTALTLSVIILAPSIVVMFHGYVYKTLLGRVIGASVFSVVALAFLIEPLGHVLMPSGYGLDVYRWLVDNRTLIIGAGMVLAIVDIFLAKPFRRHRKDS